MDRTCVMISGGAYAPFAVPEGAFVIACDRGYDHAVRAGVRPDLVIGDFDSCRGTVADGIPVERLPVRKDDTDTMHAIRYAAEHGFTSVYLVCALGGRLDHTIANLQVAVYAARHGIACVVEGADTRITPVSAGQSVTLPARPGWSLSVFAACDICRGVTITGSAYDVQDATLTNDFPIGQSNAWREDKAVISVREGILLTVESRIPEEGH